MAKFVKGDIVVIPFPFSDLSQSKRRPALVVAPLEGNDVILCQITSKTVKDSYAISIDEADFASGSLKQAGNIRPNRLFTSGVNDFMADRQKQLLALIEQAMGKAPYAGDIPEEGEDVEADEDTVEAELTISAE